MEKIRDAAKAWLAEDPDPSTRQELEELLRKNDEAGLFDRFSKRLEFGTAGLRGVLGAGPNRMNRSVVIRTTAGLGRYLLRTLPDCTNRGVVIGYDGRRLSKEAAEDTASVLAGLGIPALIFPQVAPTPLTAFAVLHMRAAAGVMITASHNPPEYNGYKVYWENGAQIIPPHDAGISAEIDRIASLAEIARPRGLAQDLPSSVEDAYVRAVKGLSRSHEGRDLVSIVYTPLHGVGGALALRVLREAGFSKIHPVEEQMEPDGRFPTVRFPNPEEPGAMDLSLACAKRTAATIVLANDPDADRLAVAVRTKTGAYQMLSGNQVGVLLAGYLLRSPRPNDLVLTTIVSSPMLGSIARALGIRYAEVLTGFKWIANHSLDLANTEGAHFVFGYEEALGYTVGTVCRDKDGISAACLFAELAADAASRGRTVLDELEALYRNYGLFLSHQLNETRDAAAIATIMESFRTRPLEVLGGLPVRALRDYKSGAKRSDGVEEKLGLPASNVLSFELSDGSRVTLRPSGTEPKIKYYFDLREAIRAGEAIASAEKRGRERIQSISRDLLREVTQRG